jgi:hypothetical protein
MVRKTHHLKVLGVCGCKYIVKKVNQEVIILTLGVIL